MADYRSATALWLHGKSSLTLFQLALASVRDPCYFGREALDVILFSVLASASSLRS